MGRTVQLKVRYANFRTITRSRTLREPTDLAADIGAVARGLLAAVPDLDRGIRLLGVSIQQLLVPEPVQPGLFGRRRSRRSPRPRPAGGTAGRAGPAHAFERTRRRRPGPVRQERWARCPAR